MVIKNVEKEVPVMASELLIYQQNVIDTYLHFVKENLSLIKTIYNVYNEGKKPYDPSQKWKLYSSKAKHLQIMTLIGLTAEHLIKLILLKRGFVLNAGEFEANFTKQFMQKLEQKNKNELNQENLNELYSIAKDNINFSFKKNLKSFEECISLFNKSDPADYYNSLEKYVLNPDPNIYNEDNYLGYKEIKPEETLKVIQKMRNSYLHLAEAQSEQKGVVWYLFNFIVWICKKEYPDFFKEEIYIGNDKNKKLFKRE